MHNKSRLSMTDNLRPSRWSESIHMILGLLAFYLLLILLLISISSIIAQGYGWPATALSLAIYILHILIAKD